MFVRSARQHESSVGTEGDCLDAGVVRRLANREAGPRIPDSNETVIARRDQNGVGGSERRGADEAPMLEGFSSGPALEQVPANAVIVGPRAQPPPSVGADSLQESLARTWTGINAPRFPEGRPVRIEFKESDIALTIGDDRQASRALERDEVRPVLLPRNR